MPTTLTLKNIPDEVYERLKAAAAAHHRSLNGEAIVCLQTVLLPQKVSVEERLERVRRLRSTLNKQDFDHDEIAALRNEGRL